MVEITAVKQQIGSCHDVLSRNGVQKPATGNYSCPFHEDKDPSFSVYQNGEKFKCHSCGIQGDSIDLQAQFDGVDTPTTLKQLFQTLPKERIQRATPEQEYLYSRGIDYQVVKDFVLIEPGYVGLNIRNGDLEIVGQQKRSIREKKFLISKGGNTGIFFENSVGGNSDLFITEGVFDFLTIRQATPHVLGYLSATSYGVGVRRILDNYRNVYWLGDQDKPGETLKENFMKIYPEINIYELPKMKDGMDVNDALQGIAKGDIVKTLKEVCVLCREGSITTARDHVARIVSELKNSKGVPFTWGSRGRDLVLGILNRGQYNVLVGEAGAGKTEFSFYLSRENAKRGHKILYVSLEMTTKGLLQRYTQKKAMVTREELLDGKIPDFKIKKVQDELDEISENIHFWGGKGVTIEEIHKKLYEKKYDMVFIDNFGFIEEQTDQEDKYQEISRQLVNLKKQNNACVIALHHFRKDVGRKGLRGLQDMRGSAKIGDDVDLAIHYCRAQGDLQREEDKYACMIRILKDRGEGEIAEFQMFFKAGNFVDSYYP